MDTTEIIILSEVSRKEKDKHYMISLTWVMLKIIEARLQYYMILEPPDVQAGFRKGRGTRDQIANICWIIEKAREFQKKHLFLLY